MNGINYQLLQPHILRNLTPQALDHGKSSKKTRSTSTGVLRTERFHAVTVIYVNMMAQRNARLLHASGTIRHLL
jgi:hypothetical protein